LYEKLNLVANGRLDQNLGRRIERFSSAAMTAFQSSKASYLDAGDKIRGVWAHGVDDVAAHGVQGIGLALHYIQPRLQFQHWLKAKNPSVSE